MRLVLFLSSSGSECGESVQTKLECFEKRLKVEEVEEGEIEETSAEKAHDCTEPYSQRGTGSTQLW